MKRVFSAVVLLVPAYFVTRYMSPQAFFALVAVILGASVLEFCSLAARRGYQAQKAAVLPASLLLAYSFMDSRLDVQLVLAVILLLIPFMALMRRDSMDKKFGNLIMTLFPIMYLGLLSGYMSGLRILPGADGHDLPFLLLFVVAAADSGAYYGGRTLGRHSMTPRLSPRKTWEGLLVGVACAVAAAFVARLWFIYSLRPMDCVILGVLLSLVGSAGDLVESSLKRWAGAKDSSGLIPGHGGVLDRVDALLFAAPVLFYYHHFMGTIAR